MLVGLISDTHDNTVRTRAAVDLLAERDPEILLHAGDLTSGQLVPLFEGFRTWLVEGNMDEPTSIRDAIVDHGVEMHYQDVHEVEAGQARVGLIHGDDAGRLEGMINAGVFDLVVHGHSHAFRDERIGATRVVNPGAVHRAKAPSVCTYDTESDRLERIDVPR